MSAPPPPPNQPAAAVGGMKGLDRPIKDVYKAVPGAKPLQSFSPASGKWWPGGLATLTQRGGANDPPVVDTTTVERLMSVLGSLTMNGDYNRGTQAIGGTIDAKIARSTSPLVGTWMESLSRVSRVGGSRPLFGSTSDKQLLCQVRRRGEVAPFPGELVVPEEGGGSCRGARLARAVALADSTAHDTGDPAADRWTSEGGGFREEIDAYARRLARRGTERGRGLPAGNALLRFPVPVQR